MMTVGEFAEKTRGIPYLPKAMFPSELYLFTREVVAQGVDHIIESGIGYGGSTAYLDRLFPDVKITSIDRGSVVATRAAHPRIEFIKGDGRFEIPRAVHGSDGKRIGILIDGPKGWTAVKLAMRMLSNKKVRLVAVHDLQTEIYSNELLLRPSLRNCVKQFIDSAHENSHDYEFRLMASDLDVNVGARSKYPDGPGLTLYHA